MVAAAAAVVELPSAVRTIGGIPIRNIWLLMLYASKPYQALDDSKRVRAEENPDEIADLVGEILCHHVERRLRRNLSYDYQYKEETMGRVRGRIDALVTESQRLLDKGMVRCKFFELSMDTPRNRYVRAALEKLGGLVVSDKLARRCRALAASFARLGVEGNRPVGYSSRSELFGLHDAADQMMVSVADLAFSLALPTEFAGSFGIRSPKIDRLSDLFEKAMLGFYRVVLDKKYRVRGSKHLSWQRSGESQRIGDILPGMITDIFIENKDSGMRLVIDTKFTSIVNDGWRRKETLDSKHIYQMYCYLRSQEKDGDEMSFSSSGMLLHPCVGEEVTEVVTIQGHPMHFCTVNLAEEAPAIRERLLRLIEIVEERSLVSA